MAPKSLSERIDVHQKAPVLLGIELPLDSRSGKLQSSSFGNFMSGGG